ncbi:MAG: dihydrofolate reductase family protein [Pseudomonadales bacterium]
MSNIVYIATSLDGYISSPDGKLDWLSYVPIPEGDDLGFAEFINRVDAVVMGRLTFETVVGFGAGWPYPVPGLVLSSTLSATSQDLADHVDFANGTPHEILELAKAKGFENLYIDGGKTIQNFMREDLIDELIISQIPLLLGGGDRLFGELDQRVNFELVSTETLLGQIVKSRYRRKYA